MTDEQPIYNPETKTVIFAGKEYRLTENPYLKYSDGEALCDDITISSELRDALNRNVYHYIAAAIGEDGQEYEIEWNLLDTTNYRSRDNMRNDDLWKSPSSVTPLTEIQERERILHTELQEREKMRLEASGQKFTTFDWLFPDMPQKDIKYKLAKTARKMLAQFEANILKVAMSKLEQCPVYVIATKTVYYNGKEYHLIENPYLKYSDSGTELGYDWNWNTNDYPIPADRLEARGRNIYLYIAAAIDETGQEYEICWHLLNKKWEYMTTRIENFFVKEQWLLPCLIDAVHKIDGHSSNIRVRVYPTPDTLEYKVADTLEQALEYKVACDREYQEWCDTHKELYEANKEWLDEIKSLPYSKEDWYNPTKLTRWCQAVCKNRRDRVARKKAAQFDAD